jgi:hypothetical protein
MNTECRPSSLACSLACEKRQRLTYPLSDMLLAWTQVFHSAINNQHRLLPSDLSCLCVLLYPIPEVFYMNQDRFFSGVKTIHHVAYMTGVKTIYVVAYMTGVKTIHLVAYMTGVKTNYIVAYMTGVKNIHLVAYDRGKTIYVVENLKRFANDFLLDAYVGLILKGLKIAGLYLLITN